MTAARPEDCPHRDLVSHGGWWRCRTCGQEIERHPDPPAYIAAMRNRLRRRHDAIDTKEVHRD